jgi:hypothetical protein
MKELTTKESRTRGLRVWRIGLLTLTLGTLLSTGCAGQDRSVSAGADLRKLPEEEPRVVDCLLPSQVRHLGTQLTYLSARQVIKTSARNCEIRGGSQQGPSATLPSLRTGADNGRFVAG